MHRSDAEDDGLTIFDLPGLSEEDAWSRIAQTMERFPELARVYDEPFLRDVARRRASPKNHLVFWLVQSRSEVTGAFWQQVVNELRLLEPEDGFARFGPKMRRTERADFQGWRTELWFAAWLKRGGIALTLEPPVGTRVAEFVTHTSPEVFWEIKSPLDIPEVRENEAALLEVQRTMRRIPEPYVLELVELNLTAADVAAAVKDIKRQITSAHAAERSLPQTSAAGGLAVAATAKTRRDHGYLGITSSGFMFQGEHGKRVTKVIRDASGQLPADRCGVVVVDRTNAEWMDETDVTEACFGEERMVLEGGQARTVHAGGVFQPECGTLISAVVSYSRTWVRGGGEYELFFVHNPFAKVPLPESLVALLGARHLRPVEIEPGRFRIELPIEHDG
jgi:hypothetical protein